ncbi:OB-fold-containig protein [Paracoccus sp. (in: a-proteobacteria)]|uniref:OB-fold-containig protein n=1 Tax=Paracoccus sp. TaxID=267 RepID=UPI0028A9F367|nr:OB-fold-containig protein [Paracoccus sp. (in: a-proteobacteria)]
MDFLLVEGLRPFSVLAGFIVVLLIVEVILVMVGLSSNIEIDGAGDGMDAGPAFDNGPDLMSAASEGDVLTVHELAMLELPPERLPRMTQRRPSLAGRLLRLCGIGKGPLLVSLTCIAAGISASGYFLQLVSESLTGSMFAPATAVAIALVPGLLLGGYLASVAARLVPSFESHAISGQTYNGRRGHVVIGDARRGDPAQVRWRDMYGTVHSLMAEPLRDDEVIPAGSEVLIVKTRERQPRIVSISAS